MWTQWFIKFSVDRGLYTLYQNPRRGALAAHWRERGEHADGGDGQDFPTCTSRDVSLDTFNAAALPKYALSARAEDDGGKPGVDSFLLQHLVD